MKEVIDLIEAAKSDLMVRDYLCEHIAAAERWVAKERELEKSFVMAIEALVNANKADRDIPDGVP